MHNVPLSKKIFSDQLTELKDFPNQSTNYDPSKIYSTSTHGPGQKTITIKFQSFPNLYYVVDGFVTFLEVYFWFWQITYRAKIVSTLAQTLNQNIAPNTYISMLMYARV